MKKLKLNRTAVFWMALASGLLLLAKQIAALFGFEITDEAIASITSIIGTVMSLLVLMGVLTNSKEADVFEAKVIKKK